LDIDNWTLKKLPPIAYLQHLFKEEKYMELIDAAALILREEPGNVRGMYWRACAYMRQGNLEAAGTDLDRAIDLFDEYADAYSQRGVLHYHLGRLDDALADMDSAVALEPGNPYRYSSRAYIKAAMHELESAINDYEKAIDLDPEDAVAHNNLGLLQEQLGYKSQAQRNLEKADRLMVNSAGELVERQPAELVLEDENMTKGQSSYFRIIKGIFTTRQGLRDYWRFVKSAFYRK
jgi:tetratricopeptide (TPR) repeat protein